MSCGDRNFSTKFAIYDLNQFPILLTMDEDGDLEFGDESVTVKTGVGKFEFFYAEPSVIKGLHQTKRFLSRNCIPSLSLEILSRQSIVLRLVSLPS